MKIAAYLGVKDEAEIIERSIAHLLDIGVDAIIAVDMYSTDGTFEILDRMSRPNVHLYRMRDDELVTQDIWSARQLDVVREIGADWVAFMDADEFWLPADGTLKSACGRAIADVVTVNRYNIVLGASGPKWPTRLRPDCYGEVLMYAKPIPDFREHMLENPETPWIRGVPMAKVMLRPDQVVGLTAGDHDAVAADGAQVARAVAADIIIAHLPFSTADRFARKVDNVRKLMTVQDPFFTGHMGWHWRRWLALNDRAAVDAEFRHQSLNDDRIAELCRAGVVRSAAEILAGT